jgi:hypothetical protein
MQMSDKSEMITINLNLNKRANADVIRQLEAQDNVREYLIRLIREDIAAHTGSRLSDMSIEELRGIEESYNAMLKVIREAAAK